MEASDCRGLGHECSELSSRYFVGVLHAPTPYTALGRALEWLGYNLRLLSDRNASKDQGAAGGLDHLAFHRVQITLKEVRTFLQSLKVSKDKPAQWWSNFAQKARFGLKESFENMIHKVEYHAWAAVLVLKVCDPAFADHRLRMFDHAGQAINGALNVLLSSSNSSDPAAVAPRDNEILHKFSRNSDYYGQDIFQAAKIFTPVHLTMFWSYKSMHALRQLERSQSVPIEAYGNLLKASWLLRRLFEDRRLEDGSEGYRSLVIVLTEEVLYQIKNVVELNLSLPTTKNLLSEADLTIWTDDLEDYEVRSENDDRNQQRAAEADQKKIRNPTRTPTAEGLVLDVRSAEPGVANHSLAAPAVPNRSERRQSPQRIMEQPESGHADLSPPKVQNAVLNGISHHSPNGRSLDHSPKLNGNGTIDRQISDPSSSGSDPRPRNGSIPWQAPPLHPPSLMPRINHSKRKPLPEIPSPRADTHSSSSRRTYSTDSTSHPHISQLSKSHDSQPPSSMQWGVPPLQNQTLGMPLNIPIKGKIEEDSDLQAYDPRFPPDSMYSAISPSQDAVAFFGNRGLDPRDHDERPGEVEIMKDIFSKMRLSASESLEFNPVWESCSVKLFRSGDQGVRVLTFRESGIDQRFIPLKEAEMVPEYGYHKDFPVLWIRRIGPDSYYQTPSTSKPFSDASAASFYYRFESAQDMFNFQLAFTGEAIETDVMCARTVRFKRSLIDGEHSHYKARVQLWRESSVPTGAGTQSPTTGSIAGTFRSRGASESLLKVHATRLVVYFDEVFLVLFVTDSITIEPRGKSNILRIKPSSYRAFNNPGSVRARLLGSRMLSGGFRLDKKGLCLADEDSFDEFKWFEIDFNSEEEMSYFKSDFGAILKDRRRERRQVEELKRLASNGVRSSR